MFDEPEGTEEPKGTNGMDNKTYRKLLVWQRAHELTKLIYKLTEKFPRAETFGLVSQIRRAIVSVVANIVEGQIRHSLKDYLHFLNMAEGSLVEVEYYLELSLDLGFLTKDEYAQADRLRKETGFLLHQLISALRKKI